MGDSPYSEDETIATLRRKLSTIHRRHPKMTTCEENGGDEDLLQRVACMTACTFVCVPGYVSVSDLEPMSLGLFPLDIASACSVNALGLYQLKQQQPQQKNTARRLSVLDLCCCPGGKFQCILDNLSTFVRQQGTAKPEALLIGVDVSQPRLDVCKSLLYKKQKFLFEHTTPQARETDEMYRPRHLLFSCDGTEFGLSSLGSLTYDSLVQGEELQETFRLQQQQHQHQQLQQFSVKRRMRSCSSSSSRSHRHEEDQHQDHAAGSVVTDGDANWDNDSWRNEDGSRVAPEDNSSLGSSGAITGHLDLQQVQASGRTEAVGTTRKRKNKSARFRLQSKLRRIEREELWTLLTQFGLGDDSALRNEMSLSSDSTSRDLLGFFSHVLVDAECSHDGSYRHMRYLTDGSAGGHSGNSTGDVATIDAATSSVMLQKPGAACSFRGPQRTNDMVVEVQKRLLDNGFRLLRPTPRPQPRSQSEDGSEVHGQQYDDLMGTLVYSTCSLDECQNEGVVRWFLETHADAELCPLSVEDLFGPPDAAPSPSSSSSEALATGKVQRSVAESADVQRALGLLRLESSTPVAVPVPEAFTPIVDEQHLPLHMQHLRHYSRLVCKHFASSKQPPYAAIAPESTCGTVLPGTVRLSKENGTSGLFIARFRKISPELRIIS